MPYRRHNRFGRAARHGAAAAWMAAVFAAMFAVGAWRRELLYAAAGLVGAALLAVAAAHLYGRERDWVHGYGHVLRVSPPPSGVYGDCGLTLIVEGPGGPQRTVALRQYRVPVFQWPSVGDRLPIRFDAYDRRKVQVLWDRMPLDGPLPRSSRPRMSYEDGQYSSSS